MVFFYKYFNNFMPIDLFETAYVPLQFVPMYINKKNNFHSITWSNNAAPQQFPYISIPNDAGRKNCVVSSSCTQSTVMITFNALPNG